MCSNSILSDISAHGLSMASILTKPVGKITLDMIRW
jgi:hypothetical protein